MKAILVAVSFTILGCSLAQLGGGSRVDPVLAALVPADTVILSGIRLADLRSTELYKKMMSQQRLSELDDLAKSTNFDPRKDVNEMLIASDGLDNIVLARGNFKPQPPAGFKKSIYKGVAIYGSNGGGYAILDASTAAVGSERGLHKVIDQKQSGGPGAAALIDRARALPGVAQIWFVSNGWGALPGRVAAEGGALSAGGRFFQTLESATATVDLRSGIAAVVNGQCRTDQDAKTMGDAVRGMVGLGRLNVPENQPEMLRLFDGIKVEQKQRSVQLNVQIPADLIDSLLKATNPRPRV